MKTNKSYLLIAAVLTFLFSFPPTQTLAQETFFDRLDKKLDVKLPNDYETKVKQFLDTCFWNVESKDNNTVRDIKTRMQNFTEQFVVEQIKNNWDIDRQNQLLFIWDAIIKKIVGEWIYDGKGENNKRIKEFKITFDSIYVCGKKYKEGIMPLVNEVNAEYDRQIAANKQQIAENEQKIAANKQQIAANKQQIAANKQQIAANKQQIAEIKERIKKGDEYLKEIRERNKKNQNEIMRLDSIGIKNMAEIYIVYTSNSDVIDDGVFNIDRMKVSAKIFVDDCKKNRIDYKDILMKEVKTREGLDDMKARRKVDEMLKFYDVE